MDDSGLAREQFEKYADNPIMHMFVFAAGGLINTDSDIQRLAINAHTAITALVVSSLSNRHQHSKQN